ncbi:Protein BRANCHLESS TRICHOME [Linum grandiflorum]
MEQRTATTTMMRNSINISQDLIIPTTTSPTWKLYRNPFFNHNSTHHLQRPSRNASVSFFDLPVFFDMEENQIRELKAELDHERRSRKKVEILNKKLARELAEERRGREALVKVCENLARKIAADKAEIDRMEKEMEEERRMLRMAEVLREERVQMKLSDARVLFEEKIRSSEELKLGESVTGNWGLGLAEEETELGIAAPSVADLLPPGKFRKLTVGCDNKWGDEREKVIVTAGAAAGVENPHIRRGIRGFVEFPRMVHRSNGGSKSGGGKDWGTKLECQKAQLRILLRQRSPIRSNAFIIS